MPQNNMTRLRFTGSHKVLLRVTSFFNHRDSGLESLADRQKIAATVPSCPRSVAGPRADAQRPAPPRGPQLVARESPSHLGSDSLGGRTPSIAQPIGNACTLKMNSSGKVADAGIDACKESPRRRRRAEHSQRQQFTATSSRLHAPLIQGHRSAPILYLWGRLPVISAPPYGPRAFWGSRAGSDHAAQSGTAPLDPHEDAR
jgi:hypothetical protein